MAESPTTRKRDIVLRDDPWQGYYGKPEIGSYGWNNVGRLRTFGKQVTVSEGHPWNENSSFKGQDIGGPFRTEKKYIEEDRSITPSPLYTFKYRNSNGNTWYYHGPIYPATPLDTAAAPYPTSIESSDAELDAWGAKAIAICKPTNSIANLTTTGAEIMREGIPRMLGANLWESRLRNLPQAVAGEFLNYQFGIAPLVNEIKDAANAAKNSEKILAQYERDAGKVVRRQYEFPIIRTIGDIEELSPKGDPWIPESHTLGQYSPYTQVLATGQGRLTRVRSTETRRWFSGAFSYYLPTGSDPRSKIQRAALEADKLFGISITPETLWELTPWSWALDYVGNIGNVFSNISDYMVNGLLLRYGYMMETTIVKDTYTRHDLPFQRYGKTTLSFHKITQVKKRRPATPFGFGLTYDGLSDLQKVILAAVGISRF